MSTCSISGASRRKGPAAEFTPGAHARADPGVSRRMKARRPKASPGVARQRHGGDRRRAPRHRAFRLRLCAPCADHEPLLHDPRGELELARRLHRAVLARPAGLRGHRRLYVGARHHDLRPAALRRHPLRRRAVGPSRLRARPPRAAHARHLPRHRHLGLRRDGAHPAHRRLLDHARRARPHRAAARRRARRRAASMSSSCC